MGLLNDFAKGFLAMTVVIWILNITTFFALGKTWAALLFLLILVMPISVIAYELWKWKMGKEKINRLDRIKQILISMHGVAFACWTFDVTSTYYVINILGVAIEQNPLGWPLGALGALTFYIPAITFTYLLLFKIKQKLAVLTATIITILTLYLGFLNFVAGNQNFSIFIHWVPSISDAYGYLFFAIAIINIIYVLVKVCTRTLKRNGK